MKLRARWSCGLPDVGDYLMSAHRPRFAYRIEGRVITRRAVSNVIPENQLEITVVRVKASEVPDGAVVHAWKWDSRAPKGTKEKSRG